MEGKKSSLSDQAASLGSSFLLCSPELLPSAWKENDHQALVRLNQKQIPPPPSGAVQHAGIKHQEQKYLLYNFPTVFISNWLKYKLSPNLTTPSQELCSHKRSPGSHRTAPKWGHLWPHRDGLHNTQWNIFNQKTSSHPSTGFLHLYRYEALKLS